MQYRECPHCGAHLDPGEVCDCRQRGDDAVKEKTMEDLAGSHDFEDVVSPGDAVSEEIVYDFLCDLRANLMQSGEPSDFSLDRRTGQMRPTYITFQRREGRWYFCGRCFEGDAVRADQMAGATT